MGELGSDQHTAYNKRKREWKRNWTKKEMGELGSDQREAYNKRKREWKRLHKHTQPSVILHELAITLRHILEENKKKEESYIV